MGLPARQEGNCPSCGGGPAQVVDSRPTTLDAEPMIRRRRRCGSCAHRWTTYEISGRLYERLFEVHDALREVQGLIDILDAVKCKIANIVGDTKQDLKPNGERAVQ